MTKTDWATRLQGIFKIKYKLGYQDGHKTGWAEGFSVGSKKALAEQRKVMIASIQKDINKNKQHYSPGVLAGLQASITMIRKMK